MQLGLFLRWIVTITILLASVVASSRAHADDSYVARASIEAAAYQDSDHVAVLTPSVAGHIENPTAGWSVDGSYLLDVISAASVDIVSTASRRWTEVRQAGHLRADYTHGDWSGEVEGSLSSEPDYLAYAVGGRITRALDEKNLLLSFGYGFGHDTIGRTGTPFSVYSHGFDHHSLIAAVTKLVDARTLFTLSFNTVIEDGDSSKPYRYIPLFSASIAPTVKAGATLADVTALRSPGNVLEQLPLTRDRFNATAQLLHKFDFTTSRLEATLYDDTWDLKAVAIDARQIFYVGKRLSLGPHARYYVQSAVNFWKLAYVGSADEVPALRTGDRELGPLINVTGGGLARYDVSRLVDQKVVLGANFDASYTGFFDDLYITHRISALLALTAEASW